MNYYKEDGFDLAIIGVDNSQRIVYDKSKMVDILVNQGWDDDDAIEHLEYNVWGAYIGEHTPIYVDLMNLNEIKIIANLKNKI